jgi:hypothetical protein
MAVPDTWHWGERVFLCRGKDPCWKDLLSSCAPSLFLVREYNSLFNWNLHGLNNSARRKVVRDWVVDTGCSNVCLQETKRELMDEQVIKKLRRTNL